MNKEKKQQSKFVSIVKEIAYDLGIDKQLVKQVLILTFKEIAITLILRGKNVMIRRFVKFVVAASAIRKMKKQNKENKNESKRTKERTTV
tara:strand:- start:1144 stop:1413 length:270 start_codon:yes stop_codon:yes gene_type:complete